MNRKVTARRGKDILDATANMVLSNRPTGRSRLASAAKWATFGAAQRPRKMRIITLKILKYYRLMSGERHQIIYLPDGTYNSARYAGQGSIDRRE